MQVAAALVLAFTSVVQLEAVWIRHNGMAQVTAVALLAVPCQQINEVRVTKR